MFLVDMFLVDMFLVDIVFVDIVFVDKGLLRDSPESAAGFAASPPFIRIIVRPGWKSNEFSGLPDSGFLSRRCGSSGISGE